MDVSVIIVNYNTSDHLKVCLNSIIQFTKNIQFEILVIDNNSSDRIIEAFPKIFTDVTFYFRDTNDGFGSGCNYGVTKASGKYLLFVNPDIILESNLFSQMICFMEKKTNVAVCSPVFINFENELIYTYNNFPSYEWEFFEFLGKGNGTKEKYLLSNQKIVEFSKEPLYVDWLTGACLMVKTIIFTKFNGFDKDYFLYYEDTDLQYRIRKEGYNIACLTFLRVKHFVNSSVKSEVGEDIYYFHLNKSKLIYYYKHFDFLKRNLLRGLMLLGTLLRMGALNFRKRYNDKREKKMMQYKKMLKIFCSNRKQLLKI